MKNKFRILKILVTVILFGFLLSFSLKRFNGQTLQKTTVNLLPTRQPVYFVDEKDVQLMVKKMHPSGKIGDLNIPAMEKKLNQLPAVDSANVYLNLNGNLMLDILQRVPAFRLNRDGKNFYVDAKGREFPTSPTYSFACMLVKGDVQPSEYEKLADLIHTIDTDDFSRKYFIGISKEKDSYNLLTSDGFYKVEIGDLDRIPLKVKGFKTFAEKYLVYQQPEKYTKISVKYDNQIVTTLNPNFAENDSLVAVGKKELAKNAVVPEKPASPPAIQPKAVKSATTVSERKQVAKPAKSIKKETSKPAVKAAGKEINKTAVQNTKKTADAPRKATVKVE